MRKLIFQMMVSLDGYFEGPNRELDWHGPVVDKEYNEYAAEFLDSIDTFVFGRVTYELMAGYWPTPLALKDDPIIASKMNSLKKIVFSRTLEKAEWNNSRLVRENPAAEIWRLKNLPGKDMAIFGSSDLSLPLIDNGLIDEYRIMVNPIVLGAGKPLFKGIKNRLKLELVGTRVFGSGLVVLFYGQKK
ncbi:MAG TPA: dihydrofolate reductase family protein [Candidatus Micrarchaeota archaeon]|nr:dihydrofolate reductase family protein [Candidatus Micrarchaeota archaeon]